MCFSTLLFFLFPDAVGCTINNNNNNELRICHIQSTSLSMNDEWSNKVENSRCECHVKLNATRRRSTYFHHQFVVAFEVTTVINIGN